MFNDYTNWSVVELKPYGVARAVNEFCAVQGWSVSFLALHSLGYHDIAVRKPVEGEAVTQVEPDQLRYSELNFQKAKADFG